MTPAPIAVSRDELLERRRRVLARLGMTLDEFTRIVAERTLTADEYDAQEELDEIAFLLGE